MGEKWFNLSVKSVIQKLNTDIENGLTSDEVSKRYETYGRNELKAKQKKSLLTKLLEQFKDFMIIVLIIAAIVSGIVGVQQGEGIADTFIILIVVIVNAIIGVAQESKAEKSLEALQKLSSHVAKVIREGEQITIEGENIVPGDIVMLEAGNYVPADCRLISASDLKIEESSLTGETMPCLKEADSILPEKTALGDMNNLAFATTVVVNGHGEAIVTDIGMNTKVGKIAKMIITNETPETPIQKKLGQVGKSLGIGCLIICLFIFVIGILKRIEPIEMFMTSVGLAVAAIPEGLPAIVTIMLSIGVTKMAKNNAIIRKLPAVETLGSTTVICSDKTGTITKGELTLSKLYNYSDLEDKEIIKIAASIENLSEHPISRAIVNYASQNLVSIEKVSEFSAIPGLGITAKYNNEKYFIGNRKLMLENNIQIYNETDEESLISDGNSILFLTNETKILALIGVKDVLKDNVKSVIDKIKSRKIDVLMLTGDNEKTAKVIADKVGIDNVVSGVLPKQKADKIKELKKNGLVMMCGDGINDSVSLVTADIGVSVSNGTDIAMDSSNVVLMIDKLDRIVDLMDISKKTIKIIKQNLFWAFIYNICMIPVAMGFFVNLDIVLNPMLASLAMTISSLTVVLNSLRLKLK